MNISDNEKENRKDRYAREVFPIVNCHECGVEHTDYDCPNCGAWTHAEKENTCPRCNEGSEHELIKRKDRQLIEGKFSRVCEDCIVAIQDDNFDARYRD